MLKIYSDLEDESAFFNVRFENFRVDLASDAGKSDSLLHLVQNGVLTRSTPTTASVSPLGMRSLQICASPSIHREVECVRNSILFNMAADPDLRLSDIAVLVVDMNRYQPALRTVFDSKGDGDGHKPIPYSLIDSNAAVESHYARGVEALLAVLADDFPRSEVFALFRNPCFQQAVSCDDDEVNEWLEAVESVGVFRGWEKLYESPELEGLFTWSQGLKRLRMGCVTDGLEDVAGLPPLSELESESAGRLSLAVERLRDFRDLPSRSGTVNDWAAWIETFLDEFLAVPDDMSHEEAIHSSIRSAFENLSILRDAGVKLDFEDIRSMLRSEMGSIPAGRGRYLGGGVVMAALQPLRPLPFKLVYIHGLDESSFPGSPENDAMDLRLRSRRIGDVNRVENMKYLFLETLMCGRDKLYLSYVARDSKKETRILPSSVLRVLSNHAAPLIPPNLRVMGDDGRELLPECVVPLSGSEPECFLPPSDDSPFDFNFNYDPVDWLLAVRDAAPAKLAEPLRAAAGSRAAETAKLAKTASAVFAPEPAASSSPANPPAPQLPPADNVVSVELRHLASFLENPLKAALGRHGVRMEDGDDPALVANEPFSIDGLAKYALFKDATDAYFRQNEEEELSFKECLNNVYFNELRKSREPVPIFANLRKFCDDKLEKSLSGVRLGLSAYSPMVGPVVIGDAEPPSNPAMSLPALELTLDDGRRVEVSGVLDDLWSDCDGLPSTVLVH